MGDAIDNVVRMAETQEAKAREGYEIVQIDPRERHARALAILRLADDDVLAEVARLRRLGWSALEVWA